MHAPSRAPITQRGRRPCIDGLRTSTVIALCVCGLLAGAFAEMGYARLAARPHAGNVARGFTGLAGLRSMQSVDAAAPCPCEAAADTLHAEVAPTTAAAPASAAAATCAPAAYHPATTATVDLSSALARLYDHNASRSSTGGSRVRVCMLVRTFADHRNKLVAMLTSVLLWEHPHLSITLLDTGREPFADLPLIAELTSAMSGRDGAVRVSTWRSAAARARFPQLGDLEDHGYVATDLAVEDLLAERQAARSAGVASDELPCDSLVITNGDNLYSFDYLAATLEAMAGGAELVSTHWVSHYDMKKEWILGWGEIQNGHCGPWRPGRDGEVAASPSFIRGCVDLGVVTFKAALLEDTGFRFVINRLRELDSPAAVASSFSAMDAMFYADGNFFRKLYEFLRDKGRVEHAVMIRRALFLHQ